MKETNFYYRPDFQLRKAVLLIFKEVACKTFNPTQIYQKINIQIYKLQIANEIEL